jgi:hypothetical protein
MEDDNGIMNTTITSFRRPYVNFDMGQHNL